MDNFAERAREFLALHEKKERIPIPAPDGLNWNHVVTTYAVDVPTLTALLASTAREAEGRERERCAVIADAVATKASECAASSYVELGKTNAAQAIAAAIRQEPK